MFFRRKKYNPEAGYEKLKQQEPERVSDPKPSKFQIVDACEQMIDAAREL